jgi:hypothetical protein
MVELEDIKAMGKLRQHIEGTLQSLKWRNEIKSVARRLIASSFFFEEICTFADGNEDIIEGAR